MRFLNQTKIIKALSIISALFFGFIFFYFGGAEFLTLSSLKANQDALKSWSEAHYSLSVLSFFLVYILVTALSLPGAAILTLASGFIFGLGPGVIVSSFASSIGAGLSFLGARFFLKDWVQTKFEGKIKKLNEGIQKEGAYYLFTLRLTPVFPFFLVNLLMGLTPISFWTYYVVSQLAMLPGTFVYVNAGTQLSVISSTQDILSPTLILSFVLLGIFPLVIKKILGSR